VATWHYTNSGGGAVVVGLPNHLAAQDAFLAPGQTVTFNDVGHNYMTVYDAVSGNVSRHGKVRELAQPGDGS
jgi:hypothetical protein